MGAALVHPSAARTRISVSIAEVRANGSRVVHACTRMTRDAGRAWAWAGVNVCACSTLRAYPRAPLGGRTRARLQLSGTSLETCPSAWMCVLPSDVIEGAGNAEYERGGAFSRSPHRAPEISLVRPHVAAACVRLCVRACARG
jgi:hypothetical protein